MASTFASRKAQSARVRGRDGRVAKSRCDPSETSTCWGLSAYQVQPTAPCDTNVFVARKLFLMNTLSRVDWGGDDNQEGLRCLSVQALFHCTCLFNAHLSRP
jgi:hypothetical protein